MPKLVEPKAKKSVRTPDGFAWFGMRGWWRPEYAAMTNEAVAQDLETHKAPSRRLTIQLRRES